MNTNFIKKMGKLVIAGAVAGLGMLAGDRIADDKSALGLFNKKNESDDTPDDNKVQMPDVTDESEHFDSTDVKVEDTVEEKEDEG
jgi:hypothetical protein